MFLTFQEYSFRKRHDQDSHIVFISLSLTHKKASNRVCMNQFQEKNTYQKQLHSSVNKTPQKSPIFPFYAKKKVTLRLNEKYQMQMIQIRQTKFDNLPSLLYNKHRYCILKPTFHQKFLQANRQVIGLEHIPKRRKTESNQQLMSSIQTDVTLE